MSQYLADPYVRSQERAPLSDHVTFAFIGGGFSGLVTGARMVENGITDVRIVEKGGDFGGTWYWSRYPKAMCDTAAFVYMPMLELDLLTTFLMLILLLNFSLNEDHESRRMTLHDTNRNTRRNCCAMALMRMSSKRLSLRSSVAGLMLLLLTSCGGVDVPSDDLQSLKISQAPSATGLANLIITGERPLVAVNALTFKEWATGDKFKGMTGREAYSLYGDGLVDAQTKLETRSIWVGRVENQIEGSSDIPFDLFALFAYRSANSFLSYMSNGAGEAPEARSAGLLGQWLICSTNFNEPELQPSTPSMNTTLPEKAQLVELTGFAEKQVETLLSHPQDQPVDILQFIKFTDSVGEQHQAYQDTITATLGQYGAQLIWRGALDFFLVGSSSPEFDEVTVTRFPSAKAFLQVYSDPKLVEFKESETTGASLRWSYLTSGVPHTLLK